jgi:gluconolactonase
MKYTLPGRLGLLTAVILSISSVQGQTIERLDPALDALIAADAKLELIIDLGEGASVEGGVWKEDASSPDSGYFLFSNRGPRQISRWSPTTELAMAHDLQKLLPDMEAESSSSSGTALDPEGRLVFCAGASHSVIRIEPDGTPTVLAHLTNGLPLHRPNDIVIKNNGSIFFTDNSRDETGKVPPAVYLIKDDKMTQIIKGGGISGPNGITLSPDGKVLYVNNSPTGSVYRYDVLADDAVANEKLFIDMSGRKEEGTTDGIKTDANGNIYNTGPGGVWIISPEGKHLGTIRTPERLTNLAFGGKDGKTLFLAGHQMLFHIQVKVGGIN